MISGVVLLLFVAVALYYCWPRPKSFFLDVTTDYLEVTTDLDTQIVWDISEATLCVPGAREETDGNRTLERNECAGLFVRHALENVELDWPDNVTLLLRSGPNRMLEILIRLEAEQSIEINGVSATAESLLRIPGRSLDLNGGLGLSGDLVLGQTAEHGTLKMLQKGRYETREKPFFRSNALLVDSGSFAMGDAVAIEPAGGEDRISSYAFLTFDEPRGDGTAPFRVIATSPESLSRLRLERARANPSYIEPNWSQRIANDPLAIGIATLLSLLATFLGVLNNLFRR